MKNSNKLHNYCFRPVDFNDPQDVAKALRFRRETHNLNLGDGAWEQEGGDEAYLKSRRKMSARDKKTIQFMIVGDDITGMIEVDEREIDGQNFGYCFFFYMSKKYRGQGYGPFLDKQACDYLRSKGHTKALLTTISTDKQAVQFYERQGRRYVGDRDTHKNAILMEKDL